MKMPYKVRNKEGHIFVFAGYENGHPWYRGTRGCKHIFESQIQYYEVIQEEAPK